MPSFKPPYEPYDPTDQASFSYETVLRRWPIILTKIIDTIHNINHELIIGAKRREASSTVAPGLQEQYIGDAPKDDWETRVAEGRQIIEKVSKLKYEMARDRALLLIPEDGEAYVELYNTALAELTEQGKGTWFTAPWLYAECYLYRLLRSWFTTTTLWRTYDPFFVQKLDAFRDSSHAVYKLAQSIHELDIEREALIGDHARLRVLFEEMVQMCLWGNATDLSLLTNLTHDDIRRLQSVGRDAHEARRPFILRDDTEYAWEVLSSLDNGRVDFVLDNAGFELFTDLLFADFLVTYTPFVSKVVFHPKSIPWFVSDVTPSDFRATFSALGDPSFFPSTSAQTADAKKHLATLLARWRRYLEAGIFELSVPAETLLGASDELLDFWTGPDPYWCLEERAPKLFQLLKETGLAIFKGDLNYRKLTGDVRWPASTPFEIAIGPLLGSFPLLSLRTNKADVVVGVDQARADELDKSGEKWRFDGRYALISFAPRHENKS